MHPSRLARLGLIAALAFLTAGILPARAADAPAPTWVSTQALGPTDAVSVAARQGLLLAAGREVMKEAFGGGMVTPESPRTPGLFRSTNGGRSWSLGSERIVRPDGDLELRPIVETPSLLAAPPTGSDAYALFDTALWRSDDEGETWAPVGDVGGPVSVLSFLANGRPVAGMTGGGLRLSADRGQTWSAFGTGLPSARVNQIAIAGTTMLVATEQGLYRSTDGGATFVRPTTGLPSPETPAWGVVAGMASETVALTTVVFLARPAHSAAGTGFFRSSDLGETWTPLPPMLSVPVPRLNPGALALATDVPNQFLGRSNALYAGTSSGLYLSLIETGVWPGGDQGVTVGAPGLEWQRIDPSPGTNGIRALAVGDRDPGPGQVDSVYAAVFRASVYRSEFHGSESGFTAPGWFDELDHGRTCLNMVARPDGALFIACGRHVFRSNDEGATWSDTDVPRYDDLQGSSYFPLVASADGSLWTSGFADGLYHSNPDVSDWTNVPFPGGSVGAVATHPTDPKILYAAGLTTNGCCRTVLQRSTDGGLTWLPVLETGDNIYSIAVSPHDGQKVLVAAFDEGGWRSEDGGATWAKVPELPSLPSSTSAVMFSPAQPGLAYAVGDDELFRSTDFGRTWVESGAGGGFPIPSPWDANTLYVTSPTNGVKVTRNAGATWQSFGEGLPGSAAGAIVADRRIAGRLYVASGVLSDLSAGPPSYWTYRLDGA